MAMRRCAGGSAVKSAPPMKIRPLETCSRPAIRRSVVDLPQPDGPSSTTSEAAAASKLTELTAGVAPQALLTFRTEICDTGSPRERPVTMPINHCIVKPVRRPGGAGDFLCLGIDQGTTSTRAILFRADTSIAAVAQQEFPQHFPADGEVEHEPEDLWTTTVATCRDAMQKAGASARGHRRHRHHQSARDHVAVGPRQRPRRCTAPSSGRTGARRIFARG